MTAVAPIGFHVRRALSETLESLTVPRFDPQDFDPPLFTRLLILQPTPFCNINCDYCYLPNRDDKARMSLQTIRLAAQRLVEDDLLHPSTTVVWHAGEPLVLPPSYYDDAFAVISEVFGPQHPVTHSIQTNATLIDDPWCEFFRRHGLRIGVSVDGPAFIHDRHRRTRRGEGTHRHVLRGLAALRRYAVPYHAIVVVTADSLDHADALYEFFESQEIHEVGFNFDEAEGERATSSLSGMEERHRKFLERMLEKMASSNGAFQVRELVNAYGIIGAGVPTYRWRGEAFPVNGQTMPLALINVACNGDFSTFSPELLGQSNARYSDFVLGNVHRDSYVQGMERLPARRMLRAVAAGVKQCERSCAYFSYCGGGAPGNKLYEAGAFEAGETLYCRLVIKHPLSLALDSLTVQQPADINNESYLGDV